MCISRETEVHDIVVDIQEIPITRLQETISESISISDALKKLNIAYSRKCKRYISDLIERKQINVDQIAINRRLKARIISNSEMFAADSKICRSNVRGRIRTDKLIEYKCAICSNPGIHNDLPLSLQLDHINGINNDHRIENLRWLCPNCHTQQDTSFGRNKKSFILKKDAKKTKTCECGNKIYVASEYCVSCYRIKQRKFDVDAEKLTELIKEHPMVEVGRMFGVSDAAIKDRCRSLGVDLSLRKNVRPHLKTKKE